MSNKEESNETDNDSLSGWTLLNQEGTNEEMDQDHEAESEGAVGPPKSQEDREPMEGEEEEEGRGSQVEELKGSEGECSDIETLDYSGHDDYPDHYQIINSEGLRLSLQNLRSHTYGRRHSVEGEEDAESLSSDSPEERILKRRSQKPEATQDEETDLSLASSPSLPDDLPAIKPEPQYIHTPDQELNSRLNLIVALTLACVLGLGLGHFLGWSSRTLWEENMNAVQVRKMRELQDSLRSCMSSVPITKQISQLHLPSNSEQHSILPSAPFAMLSHKHESSSNEEPVFSEILMSITATENVASQTQGNPHVVNVEDAYQGHSYLVTKDDIRSGNHLTVEEERELYMKNVGEELPLKKIMNHNEGDIDAFGIFTKDLAFEMENNDVYADQSVVNTIRTSQVINRLPTQKYEDNSFLQFPVINRAVEFTDVQSKGNMVDDDIVQQRYYCPVANNAFSCDHLSPHVLYEASPDRIIVTTDLNDLKSSFYMEEILFENDYTYQNELQNSLPAVHLKHILKYQKFTPDYLDNEYNDTEKIWGELYDYDAYKVDEYIPYKNKTFKYDISKVATEEEWEQCAFGFEDGLGLMCVPPRTSSFPVTRTSPLTFTLPKIIDNIQMENEELQASVLQLQSNVEPIKIRGKEGKEARELREKISHLIMENEDMRLAIARVQFDTLPDADRATFNKLAQENHHLRILVAKLIHLGPNLEKLKDSVNMLEEQSKDLFAGVARIHYEEPFPRELMQVVKEMETLKQAIIVEANKKKPTIIIQSAKSYLLFMCQVLNAFASLHDDAVGIVDKVELVKDVFALIIPKGTQISPSLQALTKPEFIVEIGQATLTKMNQIIVNVVNKLKDISYMIIMKQNQKPVELVVTLVDKMAELREKFHKTWIRLQDEVHLDKQSEKDIFGDDYVDNMVENGNNYDDGNDGTHEKDDDALLGDSKSPSSEIEDHKTVQKGQKDKLKEIELKKHMLMKEQEKKRKKAKAREESEANKKQIKPRKNNGIAEEGKNAYEKVVHHAKFQVKENNKKAPELDPKYFKGQYNKFDRNKQEGGELDLSRYRNEDNNYGSPGDRDKSGLKRHWENPDKSNRYFREKNGLKKQFIRRKGKDALWKAQGFDDRVGSVHNYKYKNFIESESGFDSNIQFSREGGGANRELLEGHLEELSFRSHLETSEEVVWKDSIEDAKEAKLNLRRNKAEEKLKTAEHNVSNLLLEKKSMESKLEEKDGDRTDNGDHMTHSEDNMNNNVSGKGVENNNVSISKVERDNAKTERLEDLEGKFGLQDHLKTGFDEKHKSKNTKMYNRKSDEPKQSELCKNYSREESKEVENKEMKIKLENENGDIKDIEEHHSENEFKPKWEKVKNAKKSFDRKIKVNQKDERSTKGHHQYRQEEDVDDRFIPYGDGRDRRKLSQHEDYEGNMCMLQRENKRNNGQMCKEESTKYQKYKGGKEGDSWIVKRGEDREKKRRMERTSDWDFDRSKTREQTRRNYNHIQRRSHEVPHQKRFQKFPKSLIR